MWFDSYGPFVFDKEFNPGWHDEFWQCVEEEYPELPSAIGCYAFCMQHGASIKPWYIGKTINQNGFHAEVFASQKIDHYKAVMNKKSRHKPIIMLFPMVTDTWRFSKNRSSGSEVIDWLETTLIGMALSRNPEIANSSKTQYFRNAYVNGVIGKQDPGRPSNSSNTAKRIFVG